jgi:DNA repair exonuclease SbcCD ATPase subunit
MAQEITIDINVVTNAAPAAAKISKELDGVKRKAKEVKDGLDEALNDTGKGDSKIKKGAADVETLKNALSPVKGLVSEVTGGMSDAFFQAFQSVKATTAGIKGLDLALKTAAFGIAILVIQEVINLYDQLVVSEEEEAEALTEAEAARKKYNDAILAGADALVKERQARAGGVNQIKREIAELEASGAKSSEIYQKKRSLIEQEKQDLIAKQEAVRGQAQAEKDVEQALLDNASALRALDLANKKANNDRKKEEAKKAAQDRFDILNRENVRREEALKTHEENVARIATAARDKRIADAKFIADFEHDADMEAFNNSIAFEERRKALGQKRVDDEKKIQDAIAFAQAANLANLESTIGALGSLFEEGTAASKAAAIAQIAIGTGVGFVNGLDIAQKSAKGTGPAAAFAFPLFYAAQIAAVLAAAGQAKKILTTVKGGGSISTPTAPSVGETPSSPSAPQFNIVGQSGTNQLAQGIGAQFDQPVRAYVVGQDVTTSQQLQRQRVRTATFG